MKNVICKLLGHKYFFDYASIYSPSTCARCGDKRAPKYKKDDHPKIKPSFTMEAQDDFIV